MKTAKVSDIVGIINKKFPFDLAEEWDSVGLQLGDPASDVTRILVALDPLPEVVDEAVARGCQLLVTHHPLIFKSLRQLTTHTTVGRLALTAARHGLALLAMHTNYDIADDGLNDLLAQKLGLKQVRPLKVLERSALVKLVVFVPESHLAVVRQALFEHAYAIGNYRDCSFSALGEGTFTPQVGASPAIGQVGALERVAEQRLELLLKHEQLPKAIKALMAVHPYEEPAYDCYPLLNEGPARGLGRIGSLSSAIELISFCELVREHLACRSVRLVGDPSREIRRVALCSGSGASVISDAVRAGADLLVTGDVKYHEARDAEACGLALIDAGHFATERLMVEAVQMFLQSSLNAAGYGCEVLAAERERDPFLFR